eukprot:CAMPEP_0184745930 /NCGR_PEP_ID=MMETSP0315-20130426/8557_1 /TAXON_ID=101924 /ORGANISM="Rhodosorus marinus, Strain UTEX LB 2760" /LENGTH=843 /DNA_ID=CAMNT_0027218305 /DNA_START=407 /DNA_END=2938 /DNA_ORIENTATION=+
MRLAIWLLGVLASANAAMMAVDLGSQFFKIAIIKPGTGLEIAFNEQSKRKTPSAVAFTDEGERLFGDAAVTYATKYPDRSFLDVRTLLGACSSSAEDPAKCIRTNATVHIGEEEHEYPTEVLAAMILAQAKKFASANLDSSVDIVRDSVITIPSWFGQVQRAALVDASKLAGLNAPVLINTNTAIALKMLFDSKEKSLNQTVLIFDVGSSSASASVLQISKTQVKTDEELTVDALAHAWDTELGGRALDEILANYVAEKFDETREGNDSVKKIPRVMARLRKEVQRLREVLSANTEAVFNVGSLYDDQDFRLQISRSEFESLAGHLFARVKIPVEKALKEANISAKDLSAVVPYGGVSRIPVIQLRLLEILGLESLTKSVNTDEGAVFGALWYGASLNSLVKSRKVDVVEHLPDSISVAVGRDNSSKKVEPQLSRLFTSGSKTPQRKTINFKRMGDFNLTLFADNQEPPIAEYVIGNVASVIEKMKDNSTVIPPKISITFNLDKAGLFEIYKAEATIEESVWTEKVVNATESASASASSGETQSEGPTESISPAETADAEPTSNNTKVERTMQTVVHRVNLSKSLDRNANALASRRMSPSDLASARQILYKLDEKDRKRKERSDALNSLESSIFQLREELYNEELEKVSTEEERDRIRAKLMEEEDWIFDADKATTQDFTSREKKLRELVGKLNFRLTELSSRPEAVEKLRKAVEYSRSSSADIRQLHEEKNSPELPKIEAFINDLDEASKFLEDSLAAQEGKTDLDDPAFKSADLESRTFALAKGLTRLTKLRLPTPTPTPSEKEKAEGQTSGEASAPAEESASADTEKETGEPTPEEKEDL